MATDSLTERPTWPSRLPLVALAGVASTLAIVQLVPFLATVPAAACLLVALASTRATGGAEPRWVVPLAAAVAGVGVIAGQLVMALGFTDHPGAALALGGLALVTAVGAVVAPRVFWLHLVVAAALHLFYVRGPEPVIDVSYYLRDSTAALLDGRNPWSLTFHNPYSAAETARLFAPDLVDGDRILIGYPYLPGSLAVYVPGHLLGEVRLVSIAALLAGTALVWRMTTDVVGRLLVATLPLTALALLVSVHYWVEPVLVLAAALLAWSLRRGSRLGGGAAVVLLLTAKQYAIVWLPLERMVRRVLGVRALLVGVGVATLLVVGAFLWSPSDFWSSVVRAQFVQPYRSDSVSLAVDLVNAGVPLPATALSVGSLLAGLGVAWWVRATAPVDATWAVLGLGLSLLATVLLSKQAFTNYFFLIHACTVFGIALWPHDRAVATAAPDAGSS